jgi:Zinc dependent phospholipase C
LLVIALLIAAIPASGYSVLTHEEIVDLTWKNMEAILIERFPGATAADLKKAHAFAYGGCVIQDMGYYPFGSRTFSDLVHYVRSGDFVLIMLREARDLDEYAFALGALAHYAADVHGHPAVNRSVAAMFPKLRARYGDAVTYADDAKSHIRTEFGFDVAQVAKHRYAPDSYHDFIGFEVSKPLLERAFLITYGVKLEDVFGSLDLSIGTYRRTVSKMIPEMTKAALLTHRAQLKSEIHNFDEKKFLYNVTRASYERDWGTEYRRPGIGARILAFLFKLVPKIGPFRAVAFETPSPQTENLYFQSVNQTVEHLRGYLRKLSTNSLSLPNLDFDTGRNTRPGEYRLTDKAFADLLHRLAKKQFAGVSPDLRQAILNFYSDTSSVNAVKRDREQWRRTMNELAELRRVGSNLADNGFRRRIGWTCDLGARQFGESHRPRRNFK